MGRPSLLSRPRCASGEAAVCCGRSTGLTIPCDGSDSFCCDEEVVCSTFASNPCAAVSPAEVCEAKVGAEATLAPPPCILCMENH